MTTRRAFLGTGAALAGLVFVGCDLLAARPARAQGRRRTTTIAGKQVKVIDVHAHCGVGEAMALMGLKLGDPTPGTRPELNMITHVSGRLQAMDEQGIDMEALSINPYWYKAERDLAKQVCQIQNEKLAAACAANPDRFVAFATVALQHPDLAVEQLEDGMKKHGLRGAGIGGSVNGDELSHPRLDPFWAKAEQLGAVIFIHPQGTGVASEIPKRFKGNGLLGNIIGNPLETTFFLSRMIFDGALDRFPGVKLCGAHAGGYLPSYIGRTDVACDVRDNANCANKKHPREYFKDQILVDSMVFSEEGLRHLVAEFGANQIVYGTDTPYNWPVGVDLILKATFLKDSEKEAILGGNLMRLLRIS